MKANLDFDKIAAALRFDHGVGEMFLVTERLAEMTSVNDDFTSDDGKSSFQSGETSNSKEIWGGELVLTISEQSAIGDVTNEEDLPPKSFEHFSERYKQVIFQSFIGNTFFVAWKLEDHCLAGVPYQHSFELSSCSFICFLF